MNQPDIERMMDMASKAPALELEIERLTKQIELEQQYSEDLLKKGAELEARVEALETRLKLANDYVESLVAMINK